MSACDGSDERVVKRHRGSMSEDCPTDASGTVEAASMMDRMMDHIKAAEHELLRIPGRSTSAIRKMKVDPEDEYLEEGSQYMFSEICEKRMAILCGPARELYDNSDDEDEMYPDGRPVRPMTFRGITTRGSDTSRWLQFTGDVGPRFMEKYNEVSPAERQEHLNKIIKNGNSSARNYTPVSLDGANVTLWLRPWMVSPGVAVGLRCEGREIWKYDSTCRYLGRGEPVSDKEMEYSSATLSSEDDY